MLQHKELRPFGPPIMKFSMPQATINDFNNCIDLITKNNLSKDLDWSKNLAGKVSEEIAIPDQIMNEHAGFFFQAAQTYVTSYHNRCKSDQSDHHIAGLYDEETETFVHKIMSSWFVRSFAGDYNPAHMHPNAHMASFGFLKLPDWEKEIEHDGADHFGLTHGCTQFIFGGGSSQHFLRNTFTIKPKVGDFYLFPAWLTHTVYPFRSTGERRSFAINFAINKVKKSSLESQKVKD